MTAQPQDTQEKTFTGWHMLAVICGFFAVVITANVTMAVFATGSWTGLVVGNSYVASQEFNGRLADARAQAERGWTSRLTFADRRLTFVLEARDGTPLSGIEAMVSMSRPIGTEQDRDIALTETDPGVYEAGAELEPGIWNAEVSALSADGLTYRQIFRFTARDAQ